MGRRFRRPLARRGRRHGRCGTRHDDRGHGIVGESAGRRLVFVLRHTQSRRWRRRRGGWRGGGRCGWGQRRAAAVINSVALQERARCVVGSGGERRTSTIGILGQQIHPTVGRDQEIEILELITVLQLELRRPARYPPQLLRGRHTSCALKRQPPRRGVGLNCLQPENGDDVRGGLWVIWRHNVTIPPGEWRMGTGRPDRDATIGQMRPDVRRQPVAPAACSRDDDNRHHHWDPKDRSAHGMEAFSRASPPTLDVSGGAVREAYEHFKKMGLEVVEPGMEVIYRPSLDDDKKCFEFGKQFAEKTIEYHKKFGSSQPPQCKP